MFLTLSYIHITAVPRITLHMFAYFPSPEWNSRLMTIVSHWVVRLIVCHSRVCISVVFCHIGPDREESSHLLKKTWGQLYKLMDSAEENWRGQYKQNGMVGDECQEWSATYEYQLARVARWPSGLERWTGDRVVMGSNPAAAASFRNFGNFDGGDNKIRRSLYLVSMPGEVKYPTRLHWKCVRLLVNICSNKHSSSSYRGLHILA